MFRPRKVITSKRIKSGKTPIANALAYFFKSEYSQSNKDNLKNYLGDGVWLGGLASQFGMQGDRVKLNDFESISTNINPKTGEKFGKKNKGSDEYDYMELTFSVPKDFSILAFLDKGLSFTDYNKALHKSYANTMVYIASQCHSKSKGELGNSQFVKCPNLLYACFQHETSRPTINPETKEVVRPDPQLHIHTILSKYVSDDFGKIRVIRRDFIYQRQKEFGAMFRAHLANELRNLGFEIIPHDEVLKTEKGGMEKIKSFGVAGITDEQRLAFSNRKREIEEIAKKLGITSIAGKDSIAQKFKTAKVKFDRDELLQAWIKTGEENGINQEFIKSLKTFKHDVMHSLIKSDEELILSAVNIYKGKEYLTEKNLIEKLTEYSQYVPINPREKLQQFLDDVLIKKVGKFNYIAIFDKVTPSPRQVKFYEKKVRLKPARFLKEYLKENKVDLKAPQHKHIAHLDISSQKPTITPAMLQEFYKNEPKKQLQLTSFGKTLESLYLTLDDLESKLRGNLKPDELSRIQARIKEVLMQIEELEKQKKNAPQP